MKLVTCIVMLHLMIHCEDNSPDFYEPKEVSSIHEQIVVLEDLGIGINSKITENDFLKNIDTNWMSQKPCHSIIHLYGRSINGNKVSDNIFNVETEGEKLDCKGFFDKLSFASGKKIKLRSLTEIDNEKGVFNFYCNGKEYLDTINLNEINHFLIYNLFSSVERKLLQEGDSTDIVLRYSRGYIEYDDPLTENKYVYTIGVFPKKDEELFWYYDLFNE